VERERQTLPSEQQAALLHLFNALDTQPARRYNVKEVRVRRCGQAVALVAHHQQAPALVVKRIPAQHGLELAQALLYSVPHSDRRNDEHPW
jgi:hypothetical protein